MLNSPTVVWLTSAAREASYRLSRLLPEGNDGVRPDADVWIFGREFPAPATSPGSEAEVARCVRACSWFTYRQGFAAIPGTVLTSDAGWGCMMRSGQMILAAALVRLQRARLRDGADGSAAGGSGDELPAGAEAAVLRLFADCAEAQFSLTRIALQGAENGIPVGRWMGPASIAQVLAQLAARGRAESSRDAVADADAPRNGSASGPPPPAANGAPAQDAPANGAPATDGPTKPAPASPATTAAPPVPPPGAPNVRILVAMDGIFYRDEVLSAAQPAGAAWEPLLLLLPLRLGLDKFSYASYGPTVLNLMKLPQCVGVIGGRPRSSYYFIGHQAERLLYLDPHEVQPALSIDAPQLPSCHYARGVRTMRLADIDPSLAFGFLLTSRACLDDFCERSSAAATGGALPVFGIAGARPAYEGRSGRTEREAGEEVEEEEEDDDLVVV
jgi:cysteine protease ATG4